MAKPRLTDVLDTLIVAITDAVNAANIQNDQNRQIAFQCGGGNVIATKLATILGKQHGNSAIAVWPLPARNAERYNPENTAQYTPQAVDLHATVNASAQTITFSGSADTAYNVHSVINGIADAYVAVSQGDSLSTIATAVAAAITGLDLPGISASAVGDVVTWVGDIFDLDCNVGGTIGTWQREVMRIARPIQVTVYSPDPVTRTAIGDVIQSSIGTADVASHFLVMSDGQPLYVRFGMRAGDKLVEAAQDSYSAFEDHIVFDTEYPITVTSTVVQVGAIVNTTVVNNNAPVTAYIGG